MNRFAVNGPDAESERKALLIAIAVSLAFISIVGVMHWSGSRRLHRQSRYYIEPDPLELSYPPKEELSPFTVPANFSRVDFYNRFYGAYLLKNGKVRKLMLRDGYDRFASDTEHWFGVKKVYYADLTGDNEPEAIVRISHVQCDVGCDGGADLFYIYSMNNGRLEKRWQYETGSYENGCGLKSLLVVDTQLVMEEFGRCHMLASRPASQSFVATTITLSIFDLDNEVFIRRKIDEYSITPQNLLNYEGQINLSKYSARSPR